MRDDLSPPAAHIAITSMDAKSGTMPAWFLQMLNEGHPELERREQETLHKLREFYPELQRAEIRNRPHSIRWPYQKTGRQLSPILCRLRSSMHRLCGYLHRLFIP